MIYMHEHNLLSKIKNNYKNKGKILEEFHKNVYLNFRNNIEKLTLSKHNPENFEEFAQLINWYYFKLVEFSKNNNISTQSKYESSFLEEINCYLFKNLLPIKNNELGIFNKRIFAGLKINNEGKISLINKDVDFCIGIKSIIKINDQPGISLTIPVVCVEVKTYLDATMFGEVKNSSSSIKYANPNSNMYLLCTYLSIANEHIISARGNSALNEIFVLKHNKDNLFDWKILYDYYCEIENCVMSYKASDKVTVPGRLFKPLITYSH